MNFSSVYTIKKMGLFLLFNTYIHNIRQHSIAIQSTTHIYPHMYTQNTQVTCTCQTNKEVRSVLCTHCHIGIAFTLTFVNTEFVDKLYSRASSQETKKQTLYHHGFWIARNRYFLNLNLNKVTIMLAITCIFQKELSKILKYIWYIPM